MNAFFASVEQAANPALRGKPVVVCGGIKKMSVVAAASYEAKKLGIKTAMSTWDAKKICPNVIIIVGDMPKYVSTSKAITKQMITYTDLVEVFSIDEAWMDLTDAKKRWEVGDETRLRQGFGGQGCGEIVIAQQLKGWIRQKFGLTCNIGIGPNKLMAKFAGELKKPDGLIVLRPEDIPGKILDVPVRELCGVGRKLEEYLAEMGVKTYGELNRCPREELVRRFGVASGEKLWEMGQGKDNSPVKPYRYEEDAKSMGHSYHMPHFTKDINEVKGYLLRLSEQVGRRLRRDHYQGNVINVTLGFGNFEFWGKSKKLSDFFDDGFDVYREAERILDAELKVNEALKFALLPRSDHKGIRFVGVTISGLRHNLDQISIFDEVENKKKALAAVDEINDRFGEFTVERAAIMNTVLQKKTGMVASGLHKKF